jgi:hypothetical protein
VRLAALRAPGGSEPWEQLGFTISDGSIALANGAIRLGGDVALLVDAPDREVSGIDGVAVGSGSVVPAVGHDNGAIELDHIVLMTDSLERTSAATEAALGLPCRRVRDTGSVRQAFHRFDDTAAARGCIVEIVENARVGAPVIWGLVVVVDDLDVAVVRARGLISPPKPAVQPGRRIATVGRAAGLPLAVAFMTR